MGGMPLLWADGPDVASDTGSRPSPARLRSRAISRTSGVPEPAGCSPSHGIAGVPRAERAVMLGDDVVSVAMEAVEMVPALPKIPALPPHDGHTHVLIESNAPQLAAAAARRDEASHWEHRLQGAVAAQAEHNQAEARSLLARAREADARRRTDRLGSMAVWAFVPLMRAFRGWALLLELGDAYAAALRSASQMLRGDAETAVGALEGAGRSLVQVLIAKPAMLDELSAMRARLHSLLEEVRGYLPALLLPGPPLCRRPSTCATFRSAQLPCKPPPRARTQYSVPTPHLAPPAAEPSSLSLTFLTPASSQAESLPAV